MSKRKTRHMLVKKVVTCDMDSIIYFNKETQKGFWLDGGFVREDYDDIRLGNSGVPIDIEYLRELPGIWVV